jgi:hypothetical protein
MLMTKRDLRFSSSCSSEYLHDRRALISTSIGATPRVPSPSCQPHRDMVSTKVENDVVGSRFGRRGARQLPMLCPHLIEQRRQIQSNTVP